MNKASPVNADRIEFMRTFIRIVEAGNMSEAAEQMGTTQPTISRRLQALERSLGVKLLKRTTHLMKLTEEGERFFIHAKELLDRWQMIESEIKGASEVPRGTLRVHVPHAFGQDQLIPPIAEYLQHYSDMTVEWHLQDKTPDFVTSGIDCAIQVGYVDDPAVVAIRLAEVPRIVVAAPYLLGKDSVGENIESLKQVPWLALQTYYRDEVSLSKISGGENFRFSIRPRLCTDSLYAIRRAAIAGLGACIVSAWIVDEDLKLGRLVHLMPQWQAQPLPVYLVYPQARFYPAKLRKFIELMRSRIPTLVGLRAHTR